MYRGIDRMGVIGLGIIVITGICLWLLTSRQNENQVPRHSHPHQQLSTDLRFSHQGQNFQVFKVAQETLLLNTHYEQLGLESDKYDKVLRRFRIQLNVQDDGHWSGGFIQMEYQFATAAFTAVNTRTYRLERRPAEDDTSRVWFSTEDYSLSECYDCDDEHMIADFELYDQEPGPPFAEVSRFYRSHVEVFERLMKGKFAIRGDAIVFP